MLKNIVLPLFLFFNVFVYAQAGYEFQTENLPYQDLVGSTSLNKGQIWDDPAYAIPLGFNLDIGGLSYNKIYFPADGLGGILSTFPAMEFGKTALIVPIAQDLIDLGETIGTSLSPISYLIDGTAGNRIVKIEWKNAGFWDDTTVSDFIDFQVWIYEGTNVIEYRYGPNQVNNPSESYEMEDGPVVAMAPLVDNDAQMFVQPALFLTGNPVNPTVTVLNGNDFPLGSLVGSIPEGTVYRFIPKPLSTDDFAKDTFQIFPNPSSDYLNIKTSIGEYEFVIYNSLGQKMDAALSDGKLNISILANGFYFLKLSTHQGTTVKKFLKN